EEPAVEVEVVGDVEEGAAVAPELLRVFELVRLEAGAAVPALAVAGKPDPVGPGPFRLVRAALPGFEQVRRRRYLFRRCGLYGGSSPRAHRCLPGKRTMGRWKNLERDWSTSTPSRCGGPGDSGQDFTQRAWWDYGPSLSDRAPWCRLRRHGGEGRAPAGGRGGAPAGA